MIPNLSRNPTALPQAIIPAKVHGARWFDPGNLLRQRKALIDYCQVLAGTGGRLGLQVIYFFVLANTLNLREMGVFASVSAAGAMLGCLTGFGFQSISFRSAAARESSLGGYLAVFYVCFAASLPLILLVSALLYFLLFRGSIAFSGYLTIIFVEVALWRIVELLIQLNNGLGRYAAAATVVMLSYGLRAAAAVAFMAAGGGDAEIWAAYYLVGNAASVALLSFLYHPRVRLRWHKTLLVGRLRDALLYAFSYFAFLAQNEVDKIVILWLAGERMAGLYAISMRIIDLTAAPLRPIFILYSKKLMKVGRATTKVLRESMRVEAVVALVSTACLFVLLALLHFWPRILGNNVASATGLLATMIAVPAVKNLLEFHAELFFAFNRMGLRGLIAAAMVVLKAAALALLLVALPGYQGWGVYLNGIYGVLYIISFATMHILLSRTASS